MLISAGQLHDQFIFVRCLDLEFADAFLCLGGFLPGIDNAETVGILIKKRYIDVPFHAQIRKNSLQLSVLGNKYDTVVHRLLGRAYLHLFALEIDLAALFPVRTDDRPHDLCSSCPYEAGEAENLSLVKLEGNRLDIIGRNIPHIKQHIADLFILVKVLVNVSEVTADHHLDELLLVHFLRNHRVYIFAVLENGNLVSNPLQLAHSMGYIYDNLPFVTELFNDAEKNIDFFIRQGSCRLVKADDLQVFPAAGFHDFHHLLVGDTEVLDLRLRLDRKTEVLNDFRCHLIGFSCINNS